LRHTGCYHADTMIDVLLRRLTSNAELLDEYASLRGRLHLARGPNARKSILATSAQPREGKTTVIVNLALATMRAGRRVAILDADMRKPRIHEVLDLPNTIGLSDVLAGHAHAGDVIQTVKTAGDDVGEASLSVITAGRGTGFAEALGEPVMRDAVKDLTGICDAVLVDSPPVLAADDALRLAPFVEGVIVVVHTGVATEDDVKLTKTRLEDAGGRVLGVVMNRFDPRVHGPSSHPYSAYYQG